MRYGKIGQDFKYCENLGQRIIKDIEDKREVKFFSLGDWKFSSLIGRNRGVEEGNGSFSISFRYDEFEVMVGFFE